MQTFSLNHYLKLIGLLFVLSACLVFASSCSSSSKNGGKPIPGPPPVAPESLEQCLAKISPALAPEIREKEEDRCKRKTLPAT